MGNLPTWKDVVSFFKDHLKIISVTVFICTVIYGIGIGYSLYSNEKASEANELSMQENSIDSDSAILTKKELDDLQNKSVSFDFYVENNEAIQFTNYNLLKKLLIAPNVIKMIEEKANSVISPSPELAINVSLDHSTYVLTLTVGTGDYKLNKLISNAYYKSFQDGSLPFFKNKYAYIVSTPKLHKQTEEEKEANKEGTLVEDSTSLSTEKIGSYGVVIIIGSAILGTIISIIYSLTRKEIADAFSYATQEEDIILNFSNLKNISKEELFVKIGHAVNHPQKPFKVLLSEIPLDSGLVSLISRGIKEQTSELKTNNSKVLIAKDLSEIDPAIHVEEVIIVIEKKRTTKKWYEIQRVQLKNYQTPVKVIQI